jgi:hypothetical protein
MSNKALNLINFYKKWGMNNTSIVDELAKGKCNSLKDLKYLYNIVKLSVIKHSDIILNDKFSIHNDKNLVSFHLRKNSVSLIHYTNYDGDISGGFIYVDGVDIKWPDLYNRHIIVQTYKLKNEYINLK